MQRIVKDLTEKLGLAVTIELCRRWGGRELSVPVKVDLSHPLALTMGLGNAERIVEHYGGQELQLPSEQNALLDMRNQAIYRECMVNGRSRESVGLDFGLTRQGVDFILRKVADMKEVTGVQRAAEAAESRA